MDNGKAIIFSAPSGSGKTTIVRHLIRTCYYLDFSISATTRPRRTGREINGKDYYFLSLEEFKKKIANNELVEWEEVYDGNHYGTLKSEIERLWGIGKHVVFDVDVKGGLKLKEYFQEKALAIFVRVNDLKVLEKRLRHRNTESEENIKRRLAKAEFEMTFENGFDITLISDKLEQTLETAEKLVSEFIFQNNS
ncbi:MAG: guanylate kinase [Cyclobacteriaceae bacterium]|nr:guanylate kinase [Cyclobacteriaceae bacterium]MCK5277782.1 guanylate kinase [Cyclobacteriaceae bacterium]